MEEDNAQGLPLENQAVASFLYAYQMESAPSSCLPRERSNQAICAGSLEEKKEKGSEGDQLHVLVDGGPSTQKRVHTSYQVL